MKYIEYDVADFVLDEFFKQWVLAPTAENSAFWEAWLQENPEKTEILAQARQMILMINFKKDHPENEDFQTVWGKIEEGIQSEEDQKPAARIVTLTPVHEAPAAKTYPYKRIAGWATVAACVLLGYFLYLQLWYQDVTITTEYGEMRKVVLPDASVVTLNANSEITYATEWNQENREVWLQGEAYFSVTHQLNDAPFIVHTQHLDVQVLGTEFNINERGEKTQVALSSGKVKVDLQEEDVPEKVLELEPGELLDYTHTDKKVSKAKADVEKEISWRNNQLIYEEATIADVIEDIEHQFGFQVQVQEKSILEHKFSGVIPTTDAEAFFITIENSFDVQIIRDGKRIVIKPN